MRLKDLASVIDATELCVACVDDDDFTEIVADITMSKGFANYHKECEKFRRFVESDEFIVVRICIIKPEPRIYVKIKKG